MWIINLRHDWSVQSSIKMGPPLSSTTGTAGTPFLFGGALTLRPTQAHQQSTPPVNVTFMVGSPGDSIGRAILNMGAFWQVTIKPQVSPMELVKQKMVITNGLGGFEGTLDLHDGFGHAVARLGPLDTDHHTAMAVGAREALWILFLQENGTVSGHQLISNTSGGMKGQFKTSSSFGCSVASLGQMHDDTAVTVAVGAERDRDNIYGETTSTLDVYGAVWILDLHSNGTVASRVKISSTSGNLSVNLMRAAMFGSAVASLGQMDPASAVTLAVGSAESDSRRGKGSVYLLHLHVNCTVSWYQRISENMGGFTDAMQFQGRFGSSLTPLGQILPGSAVSLAVGAEQVVDSRAGGGYSHGAVWIVHLRKNGTVMGQQRISNSFGGLNTTLENGADFGQSVTSLGHVYPASATSIAVGASSAVHVLHLRANGTVLAERVIREGEEGFITTAPDIQAGFTGTSLAMMDYGEMSGGNLTMAVGMDGLGSSVSQRWGGVYLLGLNLDRPAPSSSPSPTPSPSTSPSPSGTSTSIPTPTTSPETTRTASQPTTSAAASAGASSPAQASPSSAVPRSS